MKQITEYINEAAQWTTAKVEKTVDRAGGDALVLIDKFPFSKEDKKQIAAWIEDDDNITDSELADNVLELALSRCEK